MQLQCLIVLGSLVFFVKVLRGIKARSFHFQLEYFRFKKRVLQARRSVYHVLGVRGANVITCPELLKPNLFLVTNINICCCLACGHYARRSRSALTVTALRHA